MFMKEHDKLLFSIAHTLRSCREEAGLTQEELGTRAQLDRTYISGVERRVRNLTVRTLSKLLVALGISEADFLRLVLLQMEQGANSFSEEGQGNANC